MAAAWPRVPARATPFPAIWPGTQIKLPFRAQRRSSRGPGEEGWGPQSCQTKQPCWEGSGGTGTPVSPFPSGALRVRGASCSQKRGHRPHRAPGTGGQRGLRGLGP